MCRLGFGAQTDEARFAYSWVLYPSSMESSHGRAPGKDRRRTFQEDAGILKIGIATVCKGLASLCPSTWSVPSLGSEFEEAGQSNSKLVYGQPDDGAGSMVQPEYYLTNSIREKRSIEMISRLVRMIPQAVADILPKNEDEPLPYRGRAMGTIGLLELACLHRLSDEELMEKLQGGRHDALTVLFERHRVLVYRIARSILRSDTEGEDVVQEVFIDVFRAAEKYDCKKSRFKVWLLMYTYHRSIDKRRKLEAKRYYNTDGLDETEVQACLERGERRAFSLQSVEASLLVDRALTMIKPHERLAIELVYYQGLTLAEASARSGMSVKTLEHSFYRGLKKLREIISH
jgi:RNA polymerase sigma-70 factor (ECF subfamily)